MLSDPTCDGNMTSPALHDPAFEPLSGFMFEDSADDEDFRNMQRNMASFNAMTAGHQQGYRSSVSGKHGNDDMAGVELHYSANLDNPFAFDQDDLSPYSQSWHSGHSPATLHSQSIQAGIAEARGVLHQFGQITPPNDDTFKAFTAFEREPWASVKSPAKSERARNAANQRHAKAKKVRKDSVRKADSPAGDEDEVDYKRERYREKNRLAAAKCRAKKKVNTDDLEGSARAITARNNKLRAEERELRDLFSSLRDQALGHDQSRGCNCQAIHAYNMHKAHQTARGAMGLHGLMIPSPSQRTVDSDSPDTGGASSRPQSFSGLGPQMATQPTRDSLAAPVQCVDSMGGEMLLQQSSSKAGDGHSDYVFTPSPTSQTGEADGDGFQEYLRSSAVQQMHQN